ncbi:FtsX-like permease family protein [Micromonosporaceae bacterium Da 78-11]
MLRLLLGRARAQWQLPAALLAMVTVGATLLGASALLVTHTAQRALEVAASRAGTADVEVTAYTVAVAAKNARSVADDTRALLTSSLTPFRATTAGRGSAVMRPLPGRGTSAVGYLSGVENLPDQADLIAGRWPSAPGETVVLESTAQQLGLSLGTVVRLGAELTDAPAPALDVTVSGVVRPRLGAGWDRDPLAGAGFDLANREGSAAQAFRAFGPFLIDFDTLLAGGSTLNRLEISARPDLSTPDRRDLDAVSMAVLSSDRRLGRVLGDRVQLERVTSQLPLTLLTAREQQRVADATVLAVAVLGSILTATALALAGRLTADLRAGETALLVAMGAGRGQLARAAAVEAGALALLGAALAVPASSLLHAGLSRLSPLAGAGLTTGPVVTGGQVLTVVAGALGLAVLLVVLAVRAPQAAGERSRRGVLARSGADLLLVALAVTGWWQLRAQPDQAVFRTDTVRILAPALLITAGAVLALRLVPPVLSVADRLARHADGLTWPLAAFEAARRPQATAAGLLIVLAAAAGTFGLAFDATWDRSQRDQADASIGTDLALTLTAPARVGQGTAVSAATGGVVGPALDRGVAVGQWLGGGGDVPRLIAIDTSRAGSLLRGRLDDGRDWAAVGAALTPRTPVGGLTLPPGGVLTLRGTMDGGPLVVTPELMLQDATGLRTSCTTEPVVLDGRAHRLNGCVPREGVRVVAVSLPFAWVSEVWDDSRDGAVDLTLSGPGTATGDWTFSGVDLAAGQRAEPVRTATGAGLSLTTIAKLGLPPETIVATAFADPGEVPVAVSARLARDLDLSRGSRLNVAVEATSVPFVVTDVVPAVPSAPGAAALLADLDTVSRALALRADFTSPADAWWVGGPTRPDAVARAAGLHLGAVTTRGAEAARLTDGPVQAGLPAVLRLFVPATVVLLLAGLILHITCDLRARAVQVARLRGLGMTRREIRTALFGQYAVVLLPLATVGAAVGAVATWVVAPLLVRSETGAAAVPDPVPIWPWPAEAALLGVLLAGCLVVVVVVVAVQSRRADAAHLRVVS